MASRSLLAPSASGPREVALDPFDDEDSDAEAGPETRLLSDQDIARRYGGSTSAPRGGRRRSSRKNSDMSGYGRKPKNLGRKEGTYSETMLGDIRWYLKGLFWTVLVTVITMGVAITVAAILSAIWVRPQVMDVMAKVEGMSRNVDTMTELGTGAPVQMQQVWQQVKGEEMVQHGTSILQRMDSILSRVEADPNLNDELFTTFTSIATKTNHLMSQVSDAEWAQARAYGMTLLENGAAWSSNVTPALVRDALEKGRDLSNEATSLLQEARQQHLMDTLQDAGRAATQLGLRAA